MTAGNKQPIAPSQVYSTSIFPQDKKEINEVHSDHSSAINKKIFSSSHTRRNDNFLLRALCRRGKLYDYSDNRACDTNLQEKDVDIRYPVDFFECVSQS